MRPRMKPGFRPLRKRAGLFTHC